MSTESIYHKDCSYLSDKSDDTFICLSNSLMNEKRFGIKSNFDKYDAVRLLFLDRLLCDKNCALEIPDDCVKEKLNLLILKYS